MFSLNIQAQHAVWSSRNFGNVPPMYPVLGMTEELGELHEAIYQAGGQYPLPDPVVIAMQDALADITIFGIDYCTRRGINAPTAYAEAKIHGVDADPLNFVHIALGQIAHAELKLAQGIRGTEQKHRDTAEEAIGRLFVNLEAYASRFDWSLDEITAVTWSVVRERDWTANKQTGATAA